MYELIGFRVVGSHRQQESMVTKLEFFKQAMVEERDKKTKTVTAVLKENIWFPVPDKTAENKQCKDIHAWFKDAETGAEKHIGFTEESLCSIVDKLKRSVVHSSIGLPFSEDDKDFLEKDARLNFLFSLTHLRCAVPAVFASGSRQLFLGKLLALAENLRKIDVPEGVDYRACVSFHHAVWHADLEVGIIHPTEGTVKLVPSTLQQSNESEPKKEKKRVMFAADLVQPGAEVVANENALTKLRNTSARSVALKFILNNPIHPAREIDDADENQNVNENENENENEQESQSLITSKGMAFLCTVCFAGYMMRKKAGKLDIDYLMLIGRIITVSEKTLKVSAQLLLRSAQAWVPAAANSSAGHSLRTSLPK